MDIQEPSDTGFEPRSVRVTVRLMANSAREVAIQCRIALTSADTQRLRFPLAGAWTAANARADLHCLGTQFGFDFVRPRDMCYHENPPSRRMRLSEFASFGQIVRAPASGMVIASEGNQPDFPPTLTEVTFSKGPPKGKHRLAYIGNHVVIKMDSGPCVVMAHLRQGSVRVASGERVVEGTILGAVGNSGNTSGPHLHMEVLDSAPDFADLLTLDFKQSGVPFGFHRVKLHHKGRAKQSRGVVVPSKGTVLSRTRL
jgi:hypothetical protein